MIAFAFLFLGLIVGPHEVELIVQDDQIAAVRLKLDGRPVGERSGPPWIFPCDFGTKLRPHELEAIAVDAKGQVRGHARQWINLPRSPAELAILLEGADRSRPERGRLLWQHIEYSEAEKLVVRLEGRPLDTDAEGRFQLPPLAPDKPTVLRAEVVFADGSRYRAEMGVGGPRSAVIDADLTGVPVTWRGASAPPLRKLQDAFVKHGEALQVIGVEQAPGKVVMVIDLGAIRPLRSLGGLIGQGMTAASGLRRGEQVEVIFPVIKRVKGGDNRLPARLFTKSQPFFDADGGIAYVMTRAKTPEVPEEALEQSEDHQRLTDALAIGALESAEASRPRAVILVLSPQPHDESAYGIEEVMRYFETLRVPLLVWSTGEPRSVNVSEDRRPLYVDSPWGQADDISSLDRILQAIANLRHTLDAQAMVWVEGSHLPQDIALTPKAQRLMRLVGRTPERE